MNLLRLPNLILSSMVALITTFLGCIDFGNKLSSNEMERELELSTWIADWEWESGLADFRELTNTITSVQVFAAYFDHTDHLFYTKDDVKAIPRIFDIATESSFVNVDLTIVNDRFEVDGSTVQKDPELISRLVATPESRRAHIDDIIKIVSEYDFHGVEIDYEKIKDDDWVNTVIFYEELYQRLQEIEKPLRIVLEPRTPIEKINLPEGPEYVMMAYNLYGTHSNPGPKADYEFISKMTKKMDSLPGEHFIAFATGGFDWIEGGKTKALTEKEANELSKRSLDSPKRDAASGSIYFDYWDENNNRHTVWYADDVTLAQWIDIAKEDGYFKIALWRMGGLEQGTLEGFGESK